LLSRTYAKTAYVSGIAGLKNKRNIFSIEQSGCCDQIYQSVNFFKINIREKIFFIGTYRW